MNTTLLWKRVDSCVHRHPALAASARLAAQLVLAGKVAVQGDVACVGSQADSEPAAYTVNLSALTCNCADYAAAPLVDGTPHCVHLLAALLAETESSAASLPTPSISREQWDAFYRERERHELVMRTVQAGVKVLL